MFNNLIPSVIPLFHPLCHSERSEESLPPLCIEGADSSLRSE